jgi:hypothetical protein
MKFTEVVVSIILVLLIYQTFKTEKFVQTFSDALATKNYNFKNDKYGYSQADKYLASQLR